MNQPSLSRASDFTAPGGLDALADGTPLPPAQFAGQDPAADNGHALPKGWDRTPVEVSEPRVARIRAASNPLLEAARPLLRALADMPVHLDDAQVDRFKLLLADEMRCFKAAAERAELRRDHVLAVQYGLCTALDEAAHMSAWGGAAWAKNSLSIIFHKENYGGDKLFQLIGRLSTQPQAHLDVLEVMYHLLGLGFEGRYANHVDGQKHLDAIRQRLLVLINEARGTPGPALSPHWSGVPPGRFKQGRSVPPWLSAGLLALLLMALLSYDRHHLHSHQEQVEQRIAALGTVKTAPAAPATPVTTLAVAPTLDLKKLLETEVASGLVNIEQERVHRAKVTFRGDAMFAAGRTNLNPAVLPVLEKIAAAINRVNGTVMVIGHTDSQPIRNSRFASNQTLSEQRAKAVEASLAGMDIAPGRLSAIGRGSNENIAANDTAAGRAQNRRFDLVVLY
jgi:type VI secretion system protein ImpK